MYHYSVVKQMQNFRIILCMYTARQCYLYTDMVVVVVCANTVEKHNISYTLHIICNYVIHIIVYVCIEIFQEKDSSQGIIQS